LSFRIFSEVGGLQGKEWNSYMKLRLGGTFSRLNVEHRMSNFQRPILMALRFIYFKTSKPQNTDPQNFEGEIPFAPSFF
jgi:hypothetical protein